VFQSGWWHYTMQRNAPKAGYLFGSICDLLNFPLFLAPHQEVGDLKIDFFVDVPGLIGVNFEQDGALADAVMSFEQVFAGKKIETRILFIYRWQILGLDEERGVMVDSFPMSVIQSSLPAGDGKKRVFLGIFSQEILYCF